MATISKDLWRDIEAKISRGEVIPDWYLRFLTPETAMALVQLATRVQNARFLAQLRTYIHALHEVPTAPVERRKKKLKSGIPKQRSRPTPKKNKTSSMKMTGWLPPKASRPPPARSPWQSLFCYIGGSGTLPVQNDKAANLPYET